jgi:succinate dehydrogenase/fumarate reductase cytochrome b subunit
MMLTGSYRYCGGKIVQSIPITENKIIQRLFGFCLAVFLLCLAAIVPLLIAEGYSGQDAPYETLEMYDKLESILGWLILSSMLVPAACGFSLKSGAQSDLVLRSRSLRS